MKEKERIFIKAGGSIFSEDINSPFNIDRARLFRDVLSKHSTNYQFIITLGGGAAMRHYNSYLKKFGIPNRDLDWVGISVNNLNAMIMRTVFGELAEEKVIVFDMVSEESSYEFEKDFLFVGGEMPGQSGDAVAVKSALKAGSRKVLSIKDVDGIYDSDPSKNPDAKRFDAISWDEYDELFSVGDIRPGGNYPIDPVAAKLCNENDMEFVVIGASENTFEDLGKYLSGDEFIGTIAK